MDFLDTGKAVQDMDGSLDDCIVETQVFSCL